MQAISSMKEGEDTFVRIGEALDSMDRRHLGSEYRVQMIRAPEGVSGGLRLQNQLILSTSEPQVNSNASRPQSNDSDKTETVIPSDLISSCVAALLMIQVTWTFCTAVLFLGWKMFIHINFLSYYA